MLAKSDLASFTIGRWPFYHCQVCDHLYAIELGGAGADKGGDSSASSRPA